MPTSRPAFCAERWVIPDTDSVDALVETVLTEQAWWIAVRSGKHAHQGVVWAEGRRGKKPGGKSKPSNRSSFFRNQSHAEGEN